jgi:hypothetical protein
MNTNLAKTVTTTNPANFRLVLETQTLENYGSHNWDGSGECPQGWKFKGGQSIILREFVAEPLPYEISEITKKFYVDYAQGREIPGIRRNDFLIDFPMSIKLHAPHEETDDEKISREMREYEESWARR